MNSYLDVISIFLLPLLQLLILQKFMVIIWGEGKKTFLGCIGWVLYYGFLVLSTWFSFLSLTPLLLANIFFVFFICTLTGRGTLKRRLIFSLLICTIWMLAETLAGAVLYAFGTRPESLAYMGSLSSKMEMLFLSVLASRYTGEKRHAEIPLRYFVLVLLIPSGSIFLMRYIFFISTAHEEYTWLSAISGLMLLLINYIIFEAYEWILLRDELQSQNLLYKQQLDLCSRQAEEREAIYQQMRQVRHDMKNHLSSLSGMLHQGAVEEACSYLQDMLEIGIGDQSKEISHSGNLVVDSLVNYKYALAEKEGIRFEANVLIPSALPFRNDHLTIILGNLLENALEACRKVKDRQSYILLEITYVKGMLHISLRNSCLAVHKKSREGRYLTTKKDAACHGIGLASVKQAVSDYHGEMVTTDTGEEFQVTVVMYALPESDAQETGAAVSGQGQER